MNKLRALYESVLSEISNGLNEVDWEGDFKDVGKTCMKTEDVVKYLNNVRGNSDKTTKDRMKFHSKFPYMHAKSKHFEDDDKGVNIEQFIKNITAVPTSFIGQNKKMEKSGDRHTFVYHTGMPTFRGIVYDEERGNFVFVNTCPGAGQCVVGCYTLKGEYIRYQASTDKVTIGLNYLLNHPKEYEEGMYKNLKFKCEFHKAFKGYRSRVILRWNETGDFFSDKYVEIGESVIQRLKNDGYNIDSYGYTKIAKHALNSKIPTKFSTDANKREVNQVDLTKQEAAFRTPKEVAKGINLDLVGSDIEYKKRAIEYHNLNPKTTLTYDELLQRPEGNKPKWDVIVTNRDGDDASFRRDVKDIYQAEH